MMKTREKFSKLLKQHRLESFEMQAIEDDELKIAENQAVYLVRINMRESEQFIGLLTLTFDTIDRAEYEKLTKEQGYGQVYLKKIEGYDEYSFVPYKYRRFFDDGQEVSGALKVFLDRKEKETENGSI